MEESKQCDVVKSVPMSLVGKSPAAIAMDAMERGYGKEALEVLERMLELQIRYDAVEAKKAYVAAMSAFKADPPEIIKDKSVGYEAKGSKVGYMHASLSNVTDKINKALSKNGLSVAWTTAQTDKGVCVTCTITHIMGHSESTSLTAGPDTTGSKNSIQAIGSTISYLERYTVLALTGLATRDMDNDGADEKETISTDQSTEINDLINSIYGANATKGLAWLKTAFKVNAVEDLQASKYNDVITALNSARGKK